MPKKDTTFDNRDLTRLFLKHLTKDEQVKFIATFKNLVFEPEPPLEFNLDLVETILEDIQIVLSPLSVIPAVRGVLAGLETAQLAINIFQRAKGGE